jgi:hypothetical protein
MMKKETVKKGVSIVFSRSNGVGFGRSRGDGVTMYRMWLIVIIIIRTNFADFLAGVDRAAYQRHRQESKLEHLVDYRLKSKARRAKKNTQKK